MRGVHRSHHGQLVGDGGQVRQQLRDFQAGLTVLVKFPWAAKQLARLLGAGQIGSDLVEIPLAVQLVQFRLRVQEIHLARTPLHEQLDDSLGPGRTRWRLGGHVVHVQLLGFHLLGQQPRTTKQILGKQPGQGRAAQPVTDSVEEPTPGDTSRDIGGATELANRK